MIKRAYILAILVLSALTANAQQSDNRIRIGDLQTTETDGTVTVSFTVGIRHAASKNEVYGFIPVLTDGNYKVSLPAVVVMGRRTRNNADTNTYTDVIYARNGERLHYTATIEAQSWMHGGRLYIESATDGCRSVENHRDLMLSDDLRLYEAPQPREIVTEETRFIAETLADSLSITFPFVVPETMFDPDDPFRIYNEERESSLVIYFHQGKYDIDERYRDNERTLINLTAAIEMILGDSQSKVERVVVAGFASPEGAFEFNDRLAFHRAVAVKHHLLQTTELQDEQVWVYNGSVDWKGLRLLVEQSDIPQKRQIIDIIENTPIRDSQRQIGRLGELQRLDGGEPYRHMLREMFPLLRNGAFIKVYYSNE